ncbi:hypothetical protein DFP72DRAFT_1174266 [Ephemerocybe angulata]|uniref:F-box domain-containing protein n=1 Tax=Ephemerocybe angulata TaxID=980116 RepID=A0A8H6HM83_9AGAR|nr:hypothetical protein DFP72DRAFT_1174266 [Tulosesus angulatus]
MSSNRIPSQEVPTEIWTKVIRFATGPHAIQDDPALSSVLPNCLVSENFPEETLNTKCALALVCHQWNAVATTILYEHITLPIRPVARIEKLLNTLTNPVSDGGPSNLAHLVKRVDIPAVISGERIHLIVQLCKKMTNLIAFFALLENGVDPRPLLNVLPENLVHLHIQGQGTRAADPYISLGDLKDFLVGHPDLATLSIPSGLTGGHTGLQARISWPSIRKLTLQSSDQTSALARYVPTGALPNLEVVAFQGPGIPTLDWDAAIGSFLMVHGGPLVSVGLTQDDTNDFSSPMNTSLKQVDQRCPHIREIIVCFKVGPSGRSSTRIPLTWVGNDTARRMPQIVSLGIQLRFPGNNCDRMGYLQYAVVMPWTKLFPGLQRIRGLEEIDVEKYRAHDEITQKNLRSTGRFAKHPIRVEDITGNLLGQFSNGICAWA